MIRPRQTQRSAQSSARVTVKDHRSTQGWARLRGSGMIICRTPYRISFFGGGTDYPSWYRAHGGAVLATTIDKYCYLTCRHLPPFFEHRIRIVYRKIETCRSVDE